MIESPEGIWTIVVLVNAIIFCDGYGFVMFTTGPVSDSKELSALGLFVYASAYAQSLVLLCFHFIYRYALICQIEWLNALTRSQVIAGMVVLYLLFGGGYGANVVVFLFEDARVKDAFRHPFSRTFQHSIDEIVSLGGVYFIDGIANWKSWCGLSICMFFIVSSFIVILLCGRAILRTLREATMSTRIRQRQMGIFRALVVQTVIPVFCLYIPSGIVLICPIFHLSVDTTFVTVSFGVYCTLEPLVMIYFIRDYRIAVLRKAKGLAYCVIEMIEIWRWL
ncbi:unnamed protein product, partial [Mesorhabditis spiculigera]